MITIGELFAGRYEILAKLGEGGMGAVYKVRDTELHVLCALKILSGDLVRSKENRERFLREGKAMSRIAHKNVARIFRLGVEGVPYLVLEYLEGESLRAVINREGKLPAEAAVSIVMQACAGMAAAHEQNVLHRDLKPDNIMLVTVSDDQETRVKLVDFGLARFNGTDLAKSQHLTQTGALVGSVHYMSPEQCAGQKADERSDIYALGCVLFECLAGQPPYDADSAVGLLHKHRHNDIPSPFNNISGDKDQSLDAIINKALAKDPNKRYQTMLEFRSDLDSLAKGEPLICASITEKTHTRPAKARNALIVAAVITFAVFSAGLTIVSRLPNRSATNNVTKVEQEIDELILQGKYKSAIDQISDLLSKTSGDFRTSYQGRFRVKQATCFQKLGKRDEASEELKEALTDLAHTRVSSCADVVANRRAVIQAVELLTENKVACHFLDDQYVTSYELGSRTPYLNATASKVWVRAVGTLFKNCDDRQVRRALIKLEELYSKDKVGQTKAAYNFVRAYYEPSRARRRSLGKTAADLFKGEGEDWWAAEAYYWSFLNPPSMPNYAPKLVYDGLSLLPKPSPGGGLGWHSDILANYAKCMIAGGDNATAKRFCEKWLNHDPSLYKCELLYCYISALENLGRNEEAKQYLLARIKAPKLFRDMRLDAMYLTALGQLYFNAGDAENALQASTDSIDIVRDVNTALSWNSYFEMRSTNIALASSSFLRDQRLFDTLYKAAEHRHGKYKFLTLKLDELVKREKYSDINSTCESIRLYLQAHTRDTSEPHDAIALSAWHCARVGATSASLELCHEAEKLGTPNTDIYMAKLVAGEVGSLKRWLLKLLAGFEKDDDEAQEIAGILVICHMLSKDPTSAEQLESEYPLMPPKYQQLIARLALSRDGKVDLALRANPKDHAIPTFGTSSVFEKLLMARVATAYGRASDVPKYLIAARTEMVKLLPANHSAIKELDKQISSGKTRADFGNRAFRMSKAAANERV